MPDDQAIDFRSFTDRVTRAEVTRFRAETLASGQTPPSRPRTLIGAGIFEVAVSAVVLSLDLQLLRAGHRGDVAASIQVLIDWAGLVIFALLGIVGLFVMIPLGIRLAATMWPGLFRLARFASANGFAFDVSRAGPNEPFAIFGGGERRIARTVVSSPGLEFGNYSYYVGATADSARATRRIDWGYVILSVDGPLPHMVVTPRTREMLARANSVNRDRMPGIRVSDPRYFLHAAAGSELAATVALTRPLLDYLMTHEFGMETMGDRVILFHAGRFALPRVSAVKTALEGAAMARRELLAGPA